MERGWKKCGSHDRKSLDCLKQGVSRSMDANDSARGQSGGNTERGRKNICLREYLNDHERCWQ